MKYLLIMVFILCYSTLSLADDEEPSEVEITPNIPYTHIPDRLAPRIIIKENSYGDREVYETIPGTSIKDLTKPSYTIREKR